MTEQRRYLISQSGQPVAVVDAFDEKNALNRAKGLGHVLTFLPSLPMTASPVEKAPSGIPSFSADYFEMMGFGK